MNGTINAIITEVNNKLEDIARSVVLHEIEKENDALIRQHKEKFLEALDSPQ